MNIAKILKLCQTRDKVLLTLLAMGILALYSSWGRPLWVDEYLHFVFGGFDSIGDAWGPRFKRVPPTSIMGKLVFT